MDRDAFLEILRDPRYALLFLKQRISELSDREAVDLANELFIRMEAKRVPIRRRPAIAAATG